MSASTFEKTVSVSERQVREHIKLRAAKLAARTGSEKILFIEELQVSNGAARIDMAFIGNFLIGVEIKGPLDDLSRLPSQSEHYGRYFDFLVLVTDERFVEDAMRLLPTHWGIISLGTRQDSVCFRQVRPPYANPLSDTEHFLEFLWREELIALIKRYVPDNKCDRLSRPKLRDELLASAPREQLRQQCREILLARKEWRAVELVASTD
jgi:hypothetical protein